MAINLILKSENFEEQQGKNLTMKAENLEEQEGKNLSVKAENLRVRGNQSNRKIGNLKGQGQSV